MDPNEAAQPDVEETEAQQTEATAAPEVSEKPEGEEKPEKASRKNRRSYQERIAQLTAQLRQAERERDEKVAKPVAEEKAPKREDFDDYETYIEARAEFKAIKAAEQRLAEAESKSRQRQEQQQAEQQHAQFQQVRASTIDKGIETYPDFEDVALDDDIPITEPMADALLLSEKGHDIWYYLGKHPEVAEKIAGMNPVQQIKEIGRLEERLGGKQVSAAPKPTTTVQPRGASSNALSDNLPIGEWMKRRREEARKSM